MFVGYLWKLKTRGLSCLSFPFVCMLQLKQWDTVVQSALTQMFPRGDVSSMTVRHKRSEINDNFRSVYLQHSHNSVIEQLDADFLDFCKHKTELASELRSKCNNVSDATQSKRLKVDTLILQPSHQESGLIQIHNQSGLIFETYQNSGLKIISNTKLSIDIDLNITNKELPPPPPPPHTIISTNSLLKCHKLPLSSRYSTNSIVSWSDKFPKVLFQNNVVFDNFPFVFCK